jgi:hypothetical protein
MKGLIVGLLVGIIFCLFMVNKEVKITEQKTFENISNTIDSSLSRISNTVDSIIGNKEFEQVIDTPKTLTFAMYMPDNVETYMGMSIDEFYSIKTLVMQRSLMLDSGCISYFQYIRGEGEVGGEVKMQIEMDVSPDFTEYQYLNETDINTIKGLILQSESFFRDGAIFRFKYMF